MRLFFSTGISLILLLFSGLSSCREATKQATGDSQSHDSVLIAKGHPAWSRHSNIYEVNLRQYSQAGTFTAFQGELQRLKDMGVEILWFMPITPISVKDRKGTLGSYYAVQDYRNVNPEYGTMADWKSLVNKCHEMGFKVITDWVPNHTGADHPWLQSNPDFFMKDSAGNAIAPFDWSDVRELNFDNPAMRDSMIAAMKFWITETGIDGFRCDVAWGVPNDFWKQCIDSLKGVKDVFMLAEGDSPDLHKAGFDATYAWPVQNVLYGIYSGKTTVARLNYVIDSIEKLLPPGAMRLYFTVNHDENSWNGTEFERFGNAYKTFAVWTMTMNRTIPLIYSGQEEPNKKRLQFFEKDPIKWGKYELAPFYKTLLEFRKKSAGMDADADYHKFTTGKDDAVFAFVRRGTDGKSLVLINLSNKNQEFTIDDETMRGAYTNIFTRDTVKLGIKNNFSMKPWEYLVYTD